jgi:hypothetical protein
MPRIFSTAKPIAWSALKKKIAAMNAKEVLTKTSDKELNYEMFMGGEKPAMTLKYTRK